MSKTPGRDIADKIEEYCTFRELFYFDRSVANDEKFRQAKAALANSIDDLLKEAVRQAIEPA